MKKQPKFLIARNRMVDTDLVYIYHSGKPRFLAKVEGNIFEIIDDIDSMVDFYKSDMSKIEGLFKRMKDWYTSYKIFENDRDRQIHGKN